jgi:iron-sulfur cluster assembly protein
MAITLTEKAAKHINRYIERRGKGVGCVSACARPAAPAWPTSWSTSTKPAAEDNVFESHGVKVFVDPKSLPYIDGTELDFAREGLNEGFRFNNPNVKDNCGCGESFRI